MSNSSHYIIEYLYNEISKVPKDKRIVTPITLDGRLYISALIKTNNGYLEYKLPNTEQEVNMYWLDSKYDEIEDTRILHHYKTAISLVYDNGIRSVGYDGESTYEEDVDDTLYIKVDSATVLERQFYSITKEAEHITPHVDSVTINICNTITSNGITEITDTKVLGYKVLDVDSVMSPLNSDWKSYQLLGNLLKYENRV